MFTMDGVVHSCLAERVYNGFADDRASSTPITEIVCTCIEDATTVLLSDDSDLEDVERQSNNVSG